MCRLKRKGGVAYAAQELWVQNETIRDNILFGSAYDEVRYQKGYFFPTHVPSPSSEQSLL